jgi:GH15 family glucan-1,4-alpha-glucosidase
VISLPREIVLSNGRVFVALDTQMAVRDFFYPRVGLENHLVGHYSKLGIWADRKFSWINENWNVKMKYLPETLVSKCSARNQDVSLQLEINDAVHSFLDVYLRKLVINNEADQRREVRVFFSHDFHIYGKGTGDTAMYEPTLNSMIHYKQKRYFLIDGITDQDRGIYQFATGQKESFGKEGTWKDAEDGELQGNPIAQGYVDSTISFKLEIEPGSANTLYYWIACGRNFEEVKNIDSVVRKTGVEQLLLETENYWSAWSNKKILDLNVLPHDVAQLFKQSLLIMRSHVDNGGGIVSSCDSDLLQFNRDTYSYVWPRDGAIIAMAFDMAGFPEVARMFFRFCDSAIDQNGYFNHKYSPDGSIGSSWHPLIDASGKIQLPIQEDETALVLFALYKHFQRYGDLEFISKVYPKLIFNTAEFLLSYRDPVTGLPKPSFDIWEEKAGVFSSTVSTVISALQAAAGFAKVFFDIERQEKLAEASAEMKKAMLTKLYDTKAQRFRKAIYPTGIGDLTVDSSVSLAFITGAFSAFSDEVSNSMRSVIDKLWNKTNTGGVARYENDEYHRVTRDTPGNPWFICTLWLARWYIATASSTEELDKGLNLLNWTAKHASPSGILAEQIDPHTGNPISVAPLIWSHAEFVIAVCEYLEKQKELSLNLENRPQWRKVQ